MRAVVLARLADVLNGTAAVRPETATALAAMLGGPMPYVPGRGHGEPGNIINIVATVWRGMPQVAHTTAARAGVIYLSKTLATEWAPLRVRVNCIAPGLIKTDFAKALWENPDTLKAVTRGTPLRRIGEPHEIAGAAVYLAAPASTFMTGQVMVVDGGSTIGIGL